MNEEPEKNQNVFLQDGQKKKFDPIVANKVQSEVLLGMRKLERVHDGLFIVATTNQPWSIDAALKRRFDHRIFCPLPTRSEISHLLSKLLNNEKLFHKVEFEVIQHSEGFFKTLKCP